MAMTQDHLIAPCDSKLSVTRLETDTRFFIKGVEYTAGDLLRSEDLAQQIRRRLAAAVPADGGRLSPLSLSPQRHREHPGGNSGGIPHGQSPCRRHSSRFIGKTPGSIPAPKRNLAPCFKWRWARCWWVGSPTTWAPDRCSGARKRVCVEFGGSTVVLMLEPGRLQPDEDITADLLRRRRNDCKNGGTHWQRSSANRNAAGQLYDRTLGHILPAQFVYLVWR